MKNPHGLIASVIEAYTARACSRIARMIELQIDKYPEAGEALTNLAEQIKLYSMVFGPAQPDHPQVNIINTNPRWANSKTASIIELILAGQSNKQIAESLNCDISMVYVIRSRWKSGKYGSFTPENNLTGDEKSS